MFNYSFAQLMDSNGIVGGEGFRFNEQATDILAILQ